jgi:ketosteroid isomerase-like protein
MGADQEEIAQRALATIHVGNWDGWFELFDEDIVWEVRAMGLPDIQTVSGKEAVRTAFEAWIEPWDVIEFSDHSVEHHGSSLLWHYTQTLGQAKTGLRFNHTLVAVIEIRNSLIVKIRWWWDLDEARAAIADG